MKIYRYIALVVFLCTYITLFESVVECEELQGKYCYSSPKNEPLLVAEEASYSLALREAVKRSNTFKEFIDKVEDCELRKEIREIAAACATQGTKVIKQETSGRTVCTELTTHLDIKVLESIIERKLRSTGTMGETEFKGLIPSESIKVINYRREDGIITILYQAKKELGFKAVGITVNCFDGDGNLIESNSAFFPESPLPRNNIRWASLPIAEGTLTFELKIN